MNKQIKDLKEKDSLSIPLLISNVTKGVTNTGSPYMSLTLQDKTGTIEAKYWDVSAEQSTLIEPGKVYEVNLEILKYRSVLQGKVQKVLHLDQTTVSVNDFIKTSAISKDVLQKEIKEYINQIDNPTIHQMIVEVMKEYHELFFDYPAASKNHHSFVGGLATHVLGMLKLADKMVDLYPSLSRNLLYAGVLLHDIGKTEELSGTLMTEYTTQGKLLGHISIMQAKLFEIATRLKLEDSEEVMLMRHMILSHHGQLEYGSPILPLIIEAEMLQFIDNIDARMETLSRLLSETEDNAFTQRVFSLENRSFYNHKI